MTSTKIHREFERCALAYADALRAPGDDVARAARIIEARLRLWHCLIRQGWSPSPQATTAIVRDELLLNEPVGASESQTDQSVPAPRHATLTQDRA